MKKIYFIVLLNALSSIGLCAQVTGNVKLQGEIDYSGVKVLFSAVSQTAHTDSTITDTNGDYSKDLTAGTYLVKFSKAGFYDSTYSQNIFVTGNLKLNPITLVSKRYLFFDQGAPLTGIWDKSHIYVLKTTQYGNANLTITEGATIILDANVKDSTLVYIYGTVKIQGTKEQPVRIISDNPKLGFKLVNKCNITCLNTNQTVVFGPGGSITNSEFRNCYLITNRYDMVFENNKAKHLEIHSDALFGVDSNRTFNIRCNQLGTFKTRTNDSFMSFNKFNFTNNYVYGETKSNFVIDNGYNFAQDIDPKFKIENNYFKSKALNFDFNMINTTGMSASIKNNTFNGDSLYFNIYALDSLTVTDNIFKNLVFTRTYHDSKNVAKFHHNQILAVKNAQYSFPGLGVPITQNSQGNPIDTYLNVLADPLFSSPPFLQPNSPMIGAGTNGATIGIAVKGTCVEGFLNRSYAKDTLSISGFIYTPNEPYLGAIVTSINKASLKEYSDTTDAQGNFNIDSLPEGVYIIRAVPLHPLSEHYDTTYYPKKSTQAEALSIALSSNITDMKVYLRSTLVGVDDTDWQFGVYPNPFNDELVISNPHTAPLVVTDITGIEIWQGNASEGSINTSKWQPGMYLVKINNSVKRFIKD